MQDEMEYLLNVLIITIVPLLVYFVLPILWGLNVHSFPF
ncbi:hypothetical protein DB29_03020 [Shouchella clausii]|nr:hypothetical protein DB29_03020 [Shouchella clausii]